jgi:hypothetical protein
MRRARPQVEKARPRRDISDIGDPECVGSSDLEITQNQIRHGLRVTVAHRRERALPSRHALKTGLPHQPSDRFAAHMRCASCQLRPHPWHPVRLRRPAVDFRDLRRNPTIRSSRAPTSAASATPGTRWRRLRARGTSWRFGAWPDSSFTNSNAAMASSRSPAQTRPRLS